MVNEWLDLFETRAPHVVFDSGAETFARVRVTVRTGGPAILAITTGESVTEIHRYNRRVSDVVCLADGESFVTTPVGFQYIKIMVLSSGTGTVELEPIEVQPVEYASPWVGSFECSDPLVESIWKLSAQTLHLCMQNEIWDGIRRDQLPWMGDLYTEALASYHVYQDTRLTRRSLAVLSEIGPAPSHPIRERRTPGLVALWKTPGCDMNGIPSYTMWWVAGLYDYWLYTGDLSLVKELSLELSATLDHFAACVDKTGIWNFPGPTSFIDWAPVPLEERHAYCHLLAYQVLGLGIQLLESIGVEAAKWKTCHSQMNEAARKTWLKGKGFGASHHVNAMAIRSGVLSQPEAIELFNNSLAGDPPLEMTYWHRWADLDAAGCVDDQSWGLNYLRRHWGQAVHLGMTSIWEKFDISWLGEDPHAVSMISDEYAGYGGYRTSLCHGWSAGPVAWLHRNILGVCPTKPGYAQAEFRPFLGDLGCASGKVPTPHGPIEVSLECSTDGKLKASLKIPAGVDLVIPEAVRNRWQITCQ
jgi:hypothetical protein